MKVISQNTNKQRKVGISIPFNSTNVFTSTTSTKEQVKSNLFNFVLTQKGEILYDPEFGTNLRKKLYEPIIDIENFKEELLQDITNRFRSVLDSLDLEIDVDKNYSLVGIYITYVVRIDGSTDAVALTFNNGI